MNSLAGNECSFRKVDDVAGSGTVCRRFTELPMKITRVSDQQNGCAKVEILYGRLQQTVRCENDRFVDFVRSVPA